MRPAHTVGRMSAVSLVPQTYATVGVDDLKPHPQNPRRGDMGAIRDSIATNGFYGAVVAQLSSNTILAGRHRWEAAREAGVGEVPVIYLDVDDAAAKRIVLVDNRTSDLAGYDDSSLLALLQEVALEGDGLLGTGFEEDELSDLIAANDMADPPVFDTRVTSSPGGEPAAADVTRNTSPSHPPSTSEGGGAAEPKPETPKLSGRVDGSRRLIALDLPIPQFTWAVDALRRVCKEQNIATNADAVLFLLGQQIGEEVPPPHG